MHTREDDARVYIIIVIDQSNIINLFRSLALYETKTRKRLYFDRLFSKRSIWANTPLRPKSAVGWLCVCMCICWSNCFARRDDTATATSFVCFGICSAWYFGCEHIIGYNAMTRTHHVHVLRIIRSVRLDKHLCAFDARVFVCVVYVLRTRVSNGVCCCRFFHVVPQLSSLNSSSIGKYVIQSIIDAIIHSINIY